MTLMILNLIVCRAKPRLKMMWCVPVTQMVPSGFRMRDASFSHLTLNWVILREPHGPVPGTLVHRSEPAVLDRNTASGEPVRRVGEDHVHAAWGHNLHELHTVSEVHDGPRLAERPQVP